MVNYIKIMFIKLHFKKFENPTQKWAPINVNFNEIKHYWQYEDEISAIIQYKDNSQLKVRESLEDIEKLIKVYEKDRKTS